MQSLSSYESMPSLEQRNIDDDWSTSSEESLPTLENLHHMANNEEEENEQQPELLEQGEQNNVANVFNHQPNRDVVQAEAGADFPFRLEDLPPM